MSSQRLYSLATLAVAVSIFVVHGGRRVTVTGLFALSWGLFMGYSGWVVTGLDGASSAMNTALAASSFALAGSAFFLGGAPADVSDVELPGGGAWLGMIAGVGIVLLVPVRGALPPIIGEAAAFMLIVLLTVATVFGGSRHAIGLTILFVVPAVVIYAQLFHGGSGRLRLIGLLGCLALIFSAKFGRRWHKVTLLAAVPLALQLLALARLNLQAQLGSESQGRSGLESMYAPVRAFAALVDAQADHGWPLKWGSSFFTPLFVVFPDGQRPSWAPGAFNYELVALSNPMLYGTGFSTAGSWPGEWWWNFGLAGVVLCALLTGPLLRLLETTWTWAMTQVPRSRRWALVACAVLGIAGSVADLAWGGFHTWLVRGLTRLPVLLVVAVVVGSGARRSRNRHAEIRGSRRARVSGRAPRTAASR